MKIFLCFYSIFFSTICLATPKKLEVWFLSPDKTAFIDKFDNQIKFSSKVAQSQLQCQQMGEYCFDPQVGLYKPGQDGVEKTEIDYSAAEDLESYNNLPHAESLDREMIDCKDNKLFDFFCSKPLSKTSPKVKLEIWFDISSTLKEIDPDVANDICKRQSFVSAIELDCPLNSKLGVYVFTESKKQIDTISRVCSHYGLNNIDRLINDIKESNVENVIIVTDIYEANEKLLNFIENVGGTYRGVKEPMYAKDLKTYKNDLITLCK